MSLLAKTKLILKKNKIALVSKRGQNFLINEKVLDKIIEASDLKSEEVILEIGSGLGILTKELAKKVKKVVAVEIDRKLVEVLRKELAGFDNVEIICEDILKIDVIASEAKQSQKNRCLCEERSDEAIPRISDSIHGIASSVASLPSRNDGEFNYKVVANLPYNITSRVIKNFLENENQPSSAILMVQKEVAERITARPGKMSVLGVACQFFSDCEIISIVEKNNFFPVPKVDSAIVKLKVKSQKHVLSEVEGSKADEEKFFKIVKAGFSSKRKKLKSNLSKTLKIDKIKIDNVFRNMDLNENVRAQELSIKDWKSLAILLNKR